MEFVSQFWKSYWRESAQWMSLNFSFLSFFSSFSYFDIEFKEFHVFRGNLSILDEKWSFKKDVRGKSGILNPSLPDQKFDYALLKVKVAQNSRPQKFGHPFWMIPYSVSRVNHANAWKNGWARVKNSGFSSTFIMDDTIFTCTE